MAKYYAITPSEIEGMTVRSFNEYLRQIPAVERVFKGSPVAQDSSCDLGETPGDITDVLKSYGLEVPEDGR